MRCGWKMKVAPDIDADVLRRRGIQIPRREARIARPAAGSIESSMSAELAIDRIRIAEHVESERPGCVAIDARTARRSRSGEPSCPCIGTVNTAFSLVLLLPYSSPNDCAFGCCRCRCSLRAARRSVPWRCNGPSAGRPGTPFCAVVAPGRAGRVIHEANGKRLGSYDHGGPRGSIPFANCCLRQAPVPMARLQVKLDERSGRANRER